MELKEQIKTHLVEEQEKQRLERIEKNSKLKEVTIYIDGNPHSKNVVKHLESEGIKHIKKDINSNNTEWKNLVSITNLGMLPTVLVNDICLIQGRDFQNPQQLTSAIQWLGDPDLKISSNENRILEHIKTNQYNLFNKLNQLERQITPIVNILSKLSEEIAEEDGGTYIDEKGKTKRRTKNPNPNKEGGCGSNK